MNRRMLGVVTVLLGLLLALPINSQEKAPAKRKPAAPKSVESNSRSAEIWQEIGDRGKVNKVWTKSKDTWPQIVLLRLTTAQLTAFQSNPVDFVNKPDYLFSKAVIGVWDFCKDWKKSDKDMRISTEWLVMAPHSEPSDLCPAVVPYVSTKDDGAKVQAEFDKQHARKKFLIK